jgi:transposase-like protein
MTQIRTEKEMFPLVAEWLASGITQKAFSQRHGLALHLMPYWVAKYRKAHHQYNSHRQLLADLFN